MYTIAICEDEIIWQDKIKEMLNDLQKKIKISLKIDTYTSGEELLKEDFNQYDILLLDIQMKGISGVEIAKSIRKVNENIQIVFLTALESSWAEGYAVKAYRYLLKPIQVEEFHETMIGLIEAIKKNKNCIIIKSDGEIKRIQIAQIKYLAIEARKVIIHTWDETYKTTISLSEWNEKLKGFGFSNPHTSYLVNLKYVKHLDREKIILTDNEIIYVSQRKYKKFKEEFVNYIDNIK